MTQVSYINGRYVAHAEAQTHIEDRGYQFADAVYEGIGYIAGKSLDAEGHYDRLVESLSKVNIPLPMSILALKTIVERVVKANHMQTGFVYLQVSRGIVKREHSAFGMNIRPIVTIVVKHMTVASMTKVFQQGIKVDFVPDVRWDRCDIKTTGLLANCMAKTEAQSRQFHDAWLVNDRGMVTEASAANAWIVDREGCLRTKELSTHILRGITRTELLKILNDIPFREEAFTPDEALQAQEAFISSASMAIRSVVQIADKIMGDGKPGPITRRLQYDFLAARDNSFPALFGLIRE